MKRTDGAIILLLVVAFLSLNHAAFAQEEKSTFADVTKRVLLDPTTYAPAIISGSAEYLDWKSSQPFFRHGYIEANPWFTVSGRSNDVAVSFGDGNRGIAKRALFVLGDTMVNNVLENVVERRLIERYPHRRKLIRTLGWIERIAASSFITYMNSASNFKQWQENEQKARALGFAR